MSSNLPFEFRYRWLDIGARLFPDATDDQNEAIQFLEMNMRELEDFLPTVSAASGTPSGLSDDLSSVGWIETGGSAVISSVRWAGGGDTRQVGALTWFSSVTMSNFAITFTINAANTNTMLAFYDPGTTEYLVDTTDGGLDRVIGLPACGLFWDLIGEAPDNGLVAMDFSTFTTVEDLGAASGDPDRDIHVYTVTYDGTTMRISLDGVPKWSTTALNGLLGPTMIPGFIINGNTDKYIQNVHDTSF